LLLVSGRSYGFKQEDLDKLAATGSACSAICRKPICPLPICPARNHRCQIARRNLSDANCLTPTCGMLTCPRQAHQCNLSVRSFVLICRCSTVAPTCQRNFYANSQGHMSNADLFMQSYWVRTCRMRTHRGHLSTATSPVQLA